MLAALFVWSLALASGVRPCTGNGRNSCQFDHEQRLRRSYESSKARCTHGQAGVIVMLAQGSSQTPEGLAGGCRRTVSGGPLGCCG